MEVLKQTSPQADALAPKPAPWKTEPSSSAKIAFIKLFDDNFAQAFIQVYTAMTAMRGVWDKILQTDENLMLLNDRNLLHRVC
ncbi:MAG TPA: hypothetical protein VF988_13800 [Verrucomicrobiae bacterium]